MIFRRAALREFTSTAAAIFVALFLILITVILIRLLSQAAGGRVPPDAVLALIGFYAINYLPIVLALSCFIGVLLSLSRAYRESEMVVWFSSGQSLAAWVRPVVQFTFPVMLIVAGMSLVLSPWAQDQSLRYRKQLENRDEVSRVSPGTFRDSANAQRVFFVESVSQEEGLVKNIFISSEKPGKHNIVVAANGKMQTAPNGDRFVVLYDGRRYEGEPGEIQYRITRFKSYAVRLEPKEIGMIEASPKTMPTSLLIVAPTNAARGELLWRLGLPLSTLLLALLAIPLSFVNPRAGRSSNLVFAVLTFAAYMNFLGISQSWVTQGKISFAFGMWGTHVFMLVLLLVLFGWRLLPNLRRAR